MIMPFGRYKGMDIEQVPSKYLSWMIDHIDPKNENEVALIDEAYREHAWRDKYNCHVDE